MTTANPLTYCRRCDDRIIVPSYIWKNLDPGRRRDSSFSVATLGLCSPCYQKDLRDRHKERLQQLDAAHADENTRTRFCDCGCWLLVGEQCPNCRFKLIGAAA